MTTGAPTVAAALAQAKVAGVDRLDAQLLLGHVLQRSRSWLIANDTVALEPAVVREFEAKLARRAAGEPFAYVVGEKEFHGLSLRVNPKVLIPRPDTEVLVDWAIELLTVELADHPRPLVADLGTGSGAIALSVKHSHARAQVFATDISPEAIDVAAANAQRMGLQVTFLRGTWWTPLEGHRFDLVLSNPPYIATGDPHLPALGHEPELALTSEADGLSALREVIGGASGHLAVGGWLLVEHGFDQAKAVHELMRVAGFATIQTRRDLGGQPRCTGGHLLEALSA
jgi:release factor glutamine methyltransferase